MQTLSRCKLYASTSTQLNNEILTADNDTPTATTSNSVKPPPKKESALLSYKRPSSVSMVSTVVSPEETLAKYINTINLDTFGSELKPPLYTSADYSAIRPLISRLYCIPATSAPVERVFSQGGIIVRPHRAKMSDDLLEMLIYLRCSGN